MALTAFCLVTLSGIRLSATMIVVIEDKDGFWIGADSFREVGGKSPELVCKIHETPFGVVAKDGNLEGFSREGERYSIDKELYRIVTDSHTPLQFRQAVENQYREDLWAQIAYLLHDPKAGRTRIEAEVFGTPMPEYTTRADERDVVLISQEDSQPSLRQFNILPDSLPTNGGFKYYLRSLDWIQIGSQIWRIGEGVHPSLHEFGTVVDYKRDDSWILAHPESAIREVLTQAAKEYPDGVGPPYVVAHVTFSKPRKSGDRAGARPRIEWISKGKCPSWSFNLNATDEIERTVE